MKYKIILLVSIVLVGRMVHAMQGEQRSGQAGRSLATALRSFEQSGGVAVSKAGEQEEKVGDVDRDADTVREWLLEGVEIVEMEQLIESRIERLFQASWHRKILKGYTPDMVSDALAQLEHLACFQALAQIQPDRESGGAADKQAGNQPEGESELQILDGSGAARAQLERTCMIALLSKLGHAEKRVADDKYEQRWKKWHETGRYIALTACVTIPSLLIGGLWPVVRCGP